MAISQSTKAAPNSALIKALATMSERQQRFLMFMLSSKNKEYAIKAAGYTGDLNKRAIQMVRRSSVVAFLKEYAPPNSDAGLMISADSLKGKLAQIAAGELVKINTSDILKAIELLGKTISLWDGVGMKEGRDRLREIVDIFKQGAVAAKKEEEADEQTGTSAS